MEDSLDARQEIECGLVRLHDDAKDVIGDGSVEPCQEGEVLLGLVRGHRVEWGSH